MTIKREDVLRILQEEMDHYRYLMDNCSVEDSRTYYSNQTVVIAMDDVISKIKKLRPEEP